MSSILDKISESIFERLVKKGVDWIFRRMPNGIRPKAKLSANEGSYPKPIKNHPWRLCPVGESWVLTHPLTVPASKKGPEYKTTRHGFCRVNSSKSEIYTADELRAIAEQYFAELPSKIMPIPDPLGFPDGNKYDKLIAGWTKFWNEVLKPDVQLSSDLVKALVATESGFKLIEDTVSSDGPARGLIQITEGTRKILQNPKGELRDHYIEMSTEESREPAINVGAGIRWLHYKKRLAESRLKRKISWEEAAAEYKGILPLIGKNEKADEIMSKLKLYLKRLKDQRK